MDEAEMLAQRYDAELRETIARLKAECARKDGALRETLEKIRWVFKNEMYGHQITAALDVIDSALAEAAPAAGETPERDSGELSCPIECGNCHALLDVTLMRAFTEGDEVAGFATVRKTPAAPEPER